MSAHVGPLLMQLSLQRTLVPSLCYEPTTVISAL